MRTVKFQAATYRKTANLTMQTTAQPSHYLKIQGFHSKWRANAAQALTSQGRLASTRILVES